MTYFEKYLKYKNKYLKLKKCFDTLDKDDSPIKQSVGETKVNIPINPSIGETKVDMPTNPSIGETKDELVKFTKVNDDLYYTKMDIPDFPTVWFIAEKLTNKNKDKWIKFAKEEEYKLNRMSRITNLTEGIIHFRNVLEKSDFKNVTTWICLMYKNKEMDYINNSKLDSTYIDNIISCVTLSYHENGTISQHLGINVLSEIAGINSYKLKERPKYSSLYLHSHTANFTKTLNNKIRCMITVPTKIMGLLIINYFNKHGYKTQFGYKSFYDKFKLINQKYDDTISVKKNEFNLIKYIGDMVYDKTDILKEIDMYDYIITNIKKFKKYNIENFLDMNKSTIEYDNDDRPYKLKFNLNDKEISFDANNEENGWILYYPHTPTGSTVHLCVNIDILRKKIILN